MTGKKLQRLLACLLAVLLLSVAVVENALKRTFGR